MNSTKGDRRDWGLIIFIIPLGVLLIIIVGHIATQLVAQWSLFADMRSRLNPDDENLKPVSLFQPILPQILTPMAWADDFLTPDDDVVFPPFIIIDPGSTFTPTAAIQPTGGTTATPIQTNAVTPTATNLIFFPSPTSTGRVASTNTPVPPVPTATPSATMPPPSSTATSTPIINIDPSETPSETPTATPVGFPSTPPPGGEVPPPGGVGDTADGTVGNLNDGSYFVITLSTPLIVLGPSESAYDLIFYENNNGGTIYLDNIIIGISQYPPNANPHYQVFNWHDNVQDFNIDLNYAALPPDNRPPPNECLVLECDNRAIPEILLYPNPGAGIRIDVDNAASAPPPGDYWYIIVISPSSSFTPPEAAEIDAITIIP